MKLTKHTCEDMEEITVRKYLVRLLCENINTI